mmetsp:Transcript_47062/g.100739  ORF Transcript_47062/g.100739 Transcript_47062/m.100739 type:complete len:899 (+) Transcript_47062:132-2828(+)
MVSKSVVVGIDIGASDSYVAYVGKGIVDIVQNEVSKRATPSIVGFTDRERLLGDAALAQIRSNAKNSCRNFKHLLGRKLEAEDVDPEHFWSTSKLCACADGFAGYEVTYKGESRAMSAVEVTAMYLTKLREITEKWCEGKVSDCVIAVPSSFSDVQRQAVLDAAEIANIKVLRVMNEHTATALAYGIYRSNDFDPEKPMTVAFCSMGNSLFSVTIVQFIRGKLKVICEKSDKVGGRVLDECLMREFAGQFKKKVGADPLSTKKAAFKLEDAVIKTKKILSANSEAPINVECLMEDADFASNVTREDLEKMCAPAMEQAKKVLDSAFQASGFTPDQIDSVEIVGGGSRVPWVKKLCSEAFGGKELSTTMNQEESVARGCALQAAILSPLYKVRDFKVEDISPFGVNICWMGQSSNTDAKDDDGDVKMTEVEGEYKSSTVFPVNSPMNVVKCLTFYRKDSFEIKAEFTDDSPLLPLTSKELGNWKIELPPQTEHKKVKVRARLTLHGTFTIEGAQMVEEEEYEEIVKEKKEIVVEPEEQDEESEEEVAKGDVETKDAETKPAETEEASKEAPEASKEDSAGNPQETNGKAEKNSEGAEEAEEEAAEPPKKKQKKKREPEKRYEWVDVKKTKKRQRRTDLKVTSSGRPGLPPDVLQKLMDQESAMQAEMRDIIETDERRNDLEGYIFAMRDKCSESGEYKDFISAADRESFFSELTKTEDWLYDTYDATKTMYIDKVDELKKVGDAVAWRHKEFGLRDEWIKAVEGTISNYRKAAEQPGDKFGHIAGEKLATIAAACNDLEQWLKDMQAKQAALQKFEKPVLLCADMETRSAELSRMADEILREPKPSPPKEAPKEDASPEKEDEKEANTNGDDDEAPADEGAASPPEAQEESAPNDMEVD